MGGGCRGVRAALWGALLALAIGPRLSRAAEQDPAAATVFLRAIGDIRIEYKTAWRPPVERRDVELATGTGFVVAPSGLVLTSRHVIAGETSVEEMPGEEAEVQRVVRRVEAVLRGGEARRLAATLVAEDEELDLALLSVTAAELAFIPMGDSDAADPGQPVQVLGFPFGRRVEVGRSSAAGAAPTVSVSAGSLSARRRDEEGEARYLQTDATVNPGNSGGPMLDADGYAVGVVQMKISHAQGLGFAVPINRVKDFLEASGYLAQLPARRIRLTPGQGFEAKGLRLRIPEGWDDDAPTRLRLDSGESGQTLRLLVDRVASPWQPADLARALATGDSGLAGPVFRGGLTRQDERRSPAGILGSARGFAPDGAPLWMELAVLDLGAEKLVARYVGPPHEVAFNLSLLRASLEGLEGDRWLTAEIAAPLPPELPLELARLGHPAAPAVRTPVLWAQDASGGAPCKALPPPDAALSATPPGDFTVAFRFSLWASPPMGPEAAARACSKGLGSFGPDSYSRRVRRLGAEIAAEGVFVSLGDALARLELEAPVGKWGFAQHAWLAWLEANRPAQRTPGTPSK